MLDEDGIQTSQDSNRKFEKLENTSLFCIRHVSKMNPRVVFCVLEAEFGFLLLVPFLEKDTNKDYKRAIARAKGMLEKLGESIWEN
ncbi:MAG TPA: hypothetical protein VN446_00345 [Candidatus Acidoferrum sp.]|nr:hypothetical protein [Candidatus Acidoferrum sp.]